MASIKSIYECPHCHAPLTASRRPDKCPACGYDFGEAINEYKYPVTLHEQYERLQTKIAHCDAVLNMPIEKANHIMNDALNIIETIAAKNVRASDISYLIGMATQIGQIATKYHEFLQEGGRHVPSLYFKEGDAREPEETAVREGPTGAQ
jgi:hypothetical protein